jgi:rhodanese-related sulfurtransferase
VSHDAHTPLSAILIPHLDLVLDEIFAIPPARFFPELPRPKTIGELAAQAKLGLGETIARLERIEAMAHEIEIDTAGLKALIDAGPAGGGDLILLDVREAWECEICKIPGSTRLGDVRMEELMPRLKAAAEVVTICHHGVRSFSAAMYLRQHGVPKARSLEGGVDAWAQTVDRTMARY